MTLREQVRAYAKQVRADYDEIAAKSHRLRDAGAEIDYRVHLGLAMRLDEIQARLHMMADEAPDTESK